MAGRLGRRPFVRGLAATGVLGGLTAATGPAAGEHADEWPDPEDPYYASLVEEFESMGLPPGEFVYGPSEADAQAAYDLVGDLGTASSIDVGGDVPFGEATRVEVTEAPGNPWDVTYKGTVEDRPVEEGDVLLGVVYLRSGGEGEAEARYVSKDEDNLSSNMVRNTNQPTLDDTWRRYNFRVQFDYSAEAGTWWTELFLGFDAQTVDVGGLALVDFDGDVDLSALPTWLPPTETPGSGQWRTEADQRIESHRTADLEVSVVGADGEAVEGASVDVEMQDHEFGFGTAVDAPTILADGEDAETYRSKIPELFNTAVMGNHHKWRFFEEERETADAATEWLLDRGLTLRGHVCLWAAVDSWAVPPDVVSAMGIEWEDNGVTDPEADPEHVRERTTQHVRDIIEHYADFGEYGSAIDEWEVVNELYHKPGFVEAIHGEDVTPTEAPILSEWYDVAREAAPEDVSLAVNDYNTLVGPVGDARDAYERLLQHLTGEGVDLGGVGMQSHFGVNARISPEEMLATFDRYAEYTDGLRITEFDTYQGTWRDDQQKADYLEQVLVTAYSHEAVEDFVMWGFWDERHWGDDAPLFDSDWSEKPAHEVYTSLVFEEWWTSESGETGGDGSYSTAGYKGDYEVTVEAGGESETVSTTLSDGGTAVEVELGVEGGGSAGQDGGEGVSSPGFGVGAALAALAGAAWRLRSGDDDE